MFLFIVLIAFALLFAIYIYNIMQENKTKKASEAIKTGDLDTALAIFLENLKKNPENVDTLWHLGNINEEKRLYPEAIGYYNKILELNKDSQLFSKFEIYKRIGLLYRKIDRNKDALDYLLQANQLAPSSKEVLSNIAYILLEQKQFNKALSYFEKASMVMDKTPLFLTNYALCLIMNNKYSESIKYIDEALSQKIENMNLKIIRAYAEFKMKNYIVSKSFIEEILSNENFSLTSDKIYFLLKIMVICYLEERNIEIVKSLLDQISQLNINQIDANSQNEYIMMTVFMRYKQGYFNLAAEQLMKITGNPEEVSGEVIITIDKEKQKLIHLLEQLKLLDKIKVEKDKLLNNPAVTGFKSKPEAELNVLELRAKDAHQEVNKIYEDWKNKIVNNEIFWHLFGHKPSVYFDTNIVLEKYTEDKVKIIKEKLEFESSLNNNDEKLEELGIDPKDPCESFLKLDFPTFLMVSKELAEKMGFRVINQAIKLDPVAYSEGQAADFVCKEKNNPDRRVLFCVRRWREQIGYIPIVNILSSRNSFNADRIILVSYSDLSSEAYRAIQDKDYFSFYKCEDIINYLS